MNRRRMMLMNGQEVEEMGWKEVKTVVAPNDGDALYVDGFEAERIRVTAVLATVTNNTGLRFNIVEDAYENFFNMGTSTSTEFRPIQFELAIVGNYAISTAFCPPKFSVAANVQNALAGGMALPNGETLIKRFRINSANDKLKAWSWLKIEKW